MRRWLGVEGRSHHVAARPCTEKERGLSMVQWPSIGHGVTITSVARSARCGKRARCASSERQRAQCRNRVSAHAQAGYARGQGRRAAPRPCTERESPVASAATFYRRRVNSNPRGVARARGKRACCAFSPQRVSAAAHSRERTRANKPAVREVKAGAWHHCLAPNEIGLFSCAETFWSVGVASTGAVRQARVLRLLPQKARAVAALAHMRKPAAREAKAGA